VTAMELGGSHGAWWQLWSLVAVVKVEAVEERMVEPSVVAVGVEVASAMSATVEEASAMAASARAAAVEVAPVEVAPVEAASEELAPVEMALVEVAPEQLALVASKKVQRGTYRYPVSIEPEIFTSTRIP